MEKATTAPITMPTDVTSDQDFMSAPPAEQTAYLKSIDPDFAKAAPEEQKMYLSHVNRVAPSVKGPDLGGMIQKDESTARVAGLPGGSPITAPATPTMAKIAGAGIAGGALAAAPAYAGMAAPAAKFALNAMKAHPILTMVGLSAAKHIPVVGKAIQGVPEWLPLLLGEPEGAVAAEGEVAARGLAKTRLGPEMPSSSLLKSRALAEAETPAAMSAGETGEALGAIGNAGRATAIPTAPKITQKKVGDLLNEGLGGKPLTPNAPLRQQGGAIPTKESGLPTGHAAVESSAIKSYKYDPSTREFEFVSPSGAHYIHGDVSPEQAASFEAAASKGKAFNEIKKNSTYVGKVVNGKRIAVKPARDLASAAPF